MTQSLNRFLDSLPRTRVGSLSCEAPAFRTCGVAGFHVAVATALGGALLAGRSLPVAALVCLVCALSFFAYTYLRRWATGREALVLLEHVWFAEVSVAAVLAALGVPVLAYLDVVGPALAFFLAGGRTGCLLVGCCHGRPSSLGIVYGEEAARDGFPRHLVGVRLFPVQALEAAGLVLIGATGLAALPFAAEGHVFAWFLAGYAVLRFGTEALRGDRRPHLLGMSVPRWMAIGELGAALWIARDPADPAARDLGLLAVLLLALAGALLARRAFDRRPALLSPAHAAELRRAVGDAAASASPTSPAADGNGAGPERRVTSAGVSAAVSPAGPGWLHVSLSLAAGPRDLEALCRLAAAALPGVDAGQARAGPGGVLHLPVRIVGEDGGAPAPGAGEALWGGVVRQVQAAAGGDGAPAPAAPDARPDADPAADGRRAYFAAAGPVRPAVAAVRRQG
ncbi:MAG TPA: prolipoprotein diacylglyceryl transferase family protein [Longimicrobium sp.]|jgi:hypothetical protein